MNSSIVKSTSNTAVSSSCVQRCYILLKLHYFLFFASFGAVIPILSITLMRRGLTTTEVANINILIPFLIFIMNQLLGYIADRWRHYLLTFNLFYGSVAIIFSILFILAPIKSYPIEGTISQYSSSQYQLNFCASKEIATSCALRSQCGCSYKAICSDSNQDTKTDEVEKNYNFMFSMNTKNTLNEPNECGIAYNVSINLEDEYNRSNISKSVSIKRLSQFYSCNITCSIPHLCRGQRSTDETYLVIIYSVLFISGVALLSSVIPIGVSIGFFCLHDPDLFGQQRLFGTIGFGVTAFGAGWIYNIFKTELVYIIIYLMTAIPCIIVTSFIRIKTVKEKTVEEISLDDISKIKQRAKNKKKSKFPFVELVGLLKQIDVIVFLTIAFIWGISYAILDPYLYLFVDDISPCRSHSAISVMSLVASVAEVSALFLAEKLLKRYGSNILSVVVLLAFAIRFFGYYLIREAYFVAFMETMHFFNFGVLFVIIVQKAESIAPSGLSGSLQGLALGICLGLGRGTGLIIASFIFNLVHYRRLFLIFVIFNIVMAIIFSIYFTFRKENPKKPAKRQDSSTKDEEQLQAERLFVQTNDEKSDAKHIEN